MQLHRPTDTHLPLPGPRSRQRLLAAALTLAALHGASAQTAVSGSASVLSDYRYRGQSLSDGKAAYQLALNFDHASGWYAGGFATSANVADTSGEQLIGYAGYAQRLNGGGSWEAGCTRTAYTSWHMADFNECYAGLSGERSSARLYYSPRYLGYDDRTLYLEANTFYPLHEQVNLVGHAGLLHTLSGAPWPGVPEHQRYDARIGISVRLGDWSAQLARSYTQAENPPPAPIGPYATPQGPHYARPSRAWVLSASYAF